MRKQALTRKQLALTLEESRERGVIFLRQMVACCLLALFTINTLSVLAIIFLVGLNKMILSERLIMTLLAETVAQAAAIFFSVTKFIFPRR